MLKLRVEAGDLGQRRHGSGGAWAGACRCAPRPGSGPAGTVTRLPRGKSDLADAQVARDPGAGPPGLLTQLDGVQLEGFVEALALSG